MPSADFMDVRVVEAMESVCVKESFTGADFSSHLLVESCEHLLGKRYSCLQDTAQLSDTKHSVDAQSVWDHSP